MFSQSLEDRIRDKFCTCITQSFSGNDEGSFTCFQSIIPEFDEEIKSAFLKKAIEDSLITDENYLNSSYNIGYEYIGDIFENNQQYFFENCGDYFHRINSARVEGFNNQVVPCPTGQVEKLTKYIGQNEFNSSFIRDRGICYLAQSNYELALDDFNHLLERDSKDHQTKFYKAWTLEKSGSYIEASKLYKELFESTNEQVFQMSAEITKYLATKG
jgi:tetratricopeptide (TPR) repeat protein